jgi:tetratricopeptide (TPR) repeat protein
MLKKDQAEQLEAIDRELKTFLESELYYQAIERLDLILTSIGEFDDYRLLRGALLARRAEFNLELDDETQAWKDAQKAMNLGWYDARVHSIAGWAMYQTEQYDVALEQFNLAVDLDADRATSYEGRALVHMQLEEWDLARVDVSKSIQLQPDDSSAYASRAEVDIHLGALESAMRDIQKARQLDPTDRDYAHTHAALLVVGGDVKAAIQALNVATKGDDASLESLLLRSVLRLTEGDIKGAREDAMRASNAHGDEAFAFVQLSQVQMAEGNPGLALKAAERAVKLDPSLPDAYLARANAFRLKGEDEAADTDYSRAKSEPLEMMDFIFGPLAEHLDAAALLKSKPEIAPKNAEAPTGSPFAGMPGMGIPGLGGLNPAAMLDQVFDAEGNIKPAFRPIMRMAMKNAPSLLKTMPDGMLKKTGIDPNMLDNVDLDNIPEDQLEAQMKLFYKMVKSGQNPMDSIKNPKSE